MKTIITTAAAALFVTSVNAADIYRDLGFGNPELSPKTAHFDEVVAIQPSI